MQMNGVVLPRCLLHIIVLALEHHDQPSCLLRLAPLERLTIEADYIHIA